MVLASPSILSQAMHDPAYYTRSQVLDQFHSLSIQPSFWGLSSCPVLALAMIRE